MYDTKISQSMELAGGTQVIIRKAHKKDALAIQEMHDRLSHNSIRYRYNGSSKPTFRELLRLCNLAPSDGAVFVAATSEPQERIIALAQYRVYDGDTTIAELGILVEDQYQRQGLGKNILHVMAQLISSSHE